MNPMSGEKIRADAASIRDDSAFAVRRYFAHTLAPPRTTEDWEPLEKHLTEVSRIAEEFAGAFGATVWGHLVGRWHDLGKYSDEFQRYLLSSADPDAGEERTDRVDHSTFGAQYAIKNIGSHRGQMLAFCIAGHHAGLPNAAATDANGERSTLDFRLNRKRIPAVEPPLEGPAPDLKLPFSVDRKIAGFQIAFFTRMLFSALIDADRLATEAFCDPDQSAERRREKPSLTALRDALKKYLHDKQSDADKTVVNEVRARVLADCIAAADFSPGFFSLTVPTGGGKTLSSLMFSLRHALRHDLRRVVIAVPFTTIIEQTADQYRKALGSLAEYGLVEHHSNISPRRDTRQNKLATENWDAPLIVTTNVQLHESLFASATTPCRKLHRLAHSVIVLDEAQTIPIEFLHPTLLALRELVEHYGCTIVLCTATQPALERRDGFDIGIEPGAVRQIVGNAPELFVQLKRVQIARLGKLSDDDLITRLANEDEVLCIVNTRRQASALYDLLRTKTPDDGCFHLSTWMCAEHRRDALATIRQRLKYGEPCRLISTQLIEAGVDIDFPCVYRAPAGFDSIAQAAGRCNREGRLATGRVYLFDAELPPPNGLLRHAAEKGNELADQFDDPLAPEAIEAYFRLLYWSQKHRWDCAGVLDQFVDDLRTPHLRLQFREAADRYKLIGDEQISVLVAYNEEARAIRDRLLRGERADFMLLRSAQKYIVNVWANVLKEMIGKNVVIEHDSGIWLLLNENAYRSDKGLSLETSGIDSDFLIA
jgi:CRISPR-associated endonuclease/helicase Cas3